MIASQTRRVLNRAAPFTPWLLFVLTLLFYLLTLAPTVLWGDSGHFQRMAATGVLDRDGGGRVVWFIAARLMMHLPVGDPAFRANLLSALAGALTVLLVYEAGKAGGVSRRGALVAASVLVVAHTFWQHAVRAEVYTPFMALLALEIWLWFKWQRGRTWPLVAAVALCGPLLLAHQMAVLLAPALVFMCLKRRGWLRPIQWLLVVLVAVTTAALTLLVLQQQTGAAPVQAVWRYMTHFGVDFTPALFDFSVSTLPKDALMAGAFFVLQFPGPALVLGLLALLNVARKRRRLDEAWSALAILGLTDFVFALSYRVNDRYVFFLPAYLVCALFIGLGWDEAEQQRPLFRRGVVHLLMLGLLVVTPVAAYAAATVLSQRLGANLLDVRELPGREPNRYFLWPVMTGYNGAASYAQRALAQVSPGAILLADYTPYEALSYAQLVEGEGTSVQLIQVQPGADLGPLVRSFPPATQIFLADDDPRYYNLASLPNARIEPLGAVYNLRR